METDSTPLKAAHRFSTGKRLAIGFGAVISVVALFGLLGYYWLPGYAKAKLETILSEKLNRPVTVQSIDIQPYTLEITVQGFRVGEKAAVNPDSALFAFDRLYVDLSIESITRLAPIVSAVTLAAPRLHLVREDKNRFNISDLIEKFKQPEDQANDKQSKMLFSVSNISIEGGSFEFEDQVKKSHQRIAEIELRIPFIANLESADVNWVEPYLSAKINDAPFALDGKLHPFSDKREATLSLKFNDIDLTEIDEYSPIPIGIHLLSGSLDSDLSLTFTQITDEAPGIGLSGHATLKQLVIENRAVETPHKVELKRIDVTLNEANLTGPKPSQAAIILADTALTRLGETKPVIHLPKLSIDTIKVDRIQRNIELSPVILDGASASIRRQTDGQLDLTRLFAPVSLPEDSMPEAGSSSLPISTQASVSPGLVTPGKKPADTAHSSNKPRQIASLSKQAVVLIPDRKPAHTAPPSAEQGKIAEESTPSLAAAETDEAWTTQIDQVKLTGAALHFEDHTLTKIVPMNIDSLDLVIDNIDLSGIKPLDLILQAKVNQRGSIEAKGSLAWAPLATNLAIDLQHVDLVPLQGWAGDRLNALLTQGDISFQGHLKADGNPLKIALNGKGQLTKFNVLDKIKASELLRWKNIDFTGIQFINEPLRVDITSIELSDFYAHVILLPSKELNLRNLVRQEETAQAPAPAPAPVSASTESVNKAAPVDATANAPLPVRIDKIILRNGHVNFADQFIKPNYRANLTGLKGQIGPLHPGKSGKIDIRGSVDKSAPLQISGTIDPFSGQLFLDIVSVVKGIDMPTFSPYAGKYIGYVIEKGKLSVDVHYHIEQGELKAKNNIFLDQFVLGDKTDSPEAASLPLDLAISLLKNRHGEIDIHLPVSGSINDPEFSLSGIIWKAFVNLLTKAITAPFSLLGSLLGDGEELSEISFPSGHATLEPEMEKRLQALSSALMERPALKLEITGFADPVNDHEELKRALLDRRIKAQKLSESVKKGQAIGSLEEIELDEKEYAHYLTRVYKEANFEKPKNIIGLTKSLPIDEMEQLILAHTTISDEELHELAQHRASTVLHWLIEQGSISSERIFVLGTKVESASAGQQPNSHVVFSIQ
ncbi:DUF748 domain-containing protein [Nitrosomonas sp. Nm132]|uniref:DUF748 domain-containing protein n=1 Tax=Nitrosomonas sp. Nm132 TaxID=1881053 RepID=UPI00088A395F|nr:DUF748 domain-containing protein [Nitrosomonas sp. Nm132]SDG91743.1 protein of unknown function [Nitrosomonas sp. Nm132]